MLQFLSNYKFSLPLKTLNTLYGTLVLPYLNYCNIIWANNKSSRLQPILLLQKRAMRIITNSSYQTHALPLFSILKQLTIFDLNKLLIATLMYRHHTNCLPIVFRGYFVANSTVHSHFTRNCSKLHISYARTDIMKSQLKIAGPKLWNTIDPAIINKSNHWHSFKRNYKHFLLSKYV